MRVERWPVETALARRAEIVGVFQRAFGYSDARAASFEDFFMEGVRYDGSLVLVAVDEQGRVLGFVFGFDFERGHWWPDLIAPALDTAGLQQWHADAFELVEIEVEPTWQGRGLGGELLRALANQCRKSTILLGTSASPTNRAPALYEREEFVDLLPGFAYPNGTRARIMGRALSAI